MLRKNLECLSKEELVNAMVKFEENKSVGVGEFLEKEYPSLAIKRYKNEKLNLVASVQPDIDGDDYAATVNLKTGLFMGENLDVLEKEGWQEISLVEIKEELSQLDDCEVRICSECGCLMLDGYVIGDGLEYYCKDDCLHKHYTEEEWQDMYEDGGDCYWTEFYF